MSDERGGLTIITAKQEQARLAKGFRLGRRLWLTADRKSVVEAGDPRAAFLLNGHDRPITPEEADRFGIQPPAPAAPEVKQEPKPADKAVERSQVEDKSVRRGRKGN